MELRELISFYHVARLRSVSKAARKLEVGQPAVTTHIRRLEAEFGLTLFDRIKRPMQLTSEGKAFLELVDPMVQAADGLKAQMAYSQERGAFIVGAYPDLVTHHLPRAIQPFRSRYPDVRIRLIARSYLSLIQLVKAGEVDLAVCSPPPFDDPSLEFKSLFQSNVVLITPPDHVLHQSHPVQLHKIAQYPLILSGPESLTRQKVEQALKSHGLTCEVVLEVDNAESIKRYVEIGMGVAITSDFTLHPEDHHKLEVVRLDHIFPSSCIGICTLKGKFLGRSVRNFIDTMNDEMQGFHAEVWDWPDGQDDRAPHAGVPPETAQPVGHWGTPRVRTKYVFPKPISVKY